MPIIPDFEPSRGRSSPAAPSLGAATAGARSLIAAGADISKAGDDLGREQLRRQEMRDHDVDVRARLAMQGAYQEHEQFKAENPDENGWEQDIAARLGSVREQFGKEKMSPQGRQAFDLQMQGWEKSKVAETRLAATKQQSARTRTNAVRLAEQYRRSDEYDQADAVIRDSPAFDPEEKKIELMENGRLRQLADARKEDERERGIIAGDPAGWLESHPADKVPNGADPYAYAQRRGFALSLHTRNQQELQDTVMEGISAGKIRTGAEIDHLTEDALPSVRERLQSELAARSDAAEKLRRQSPEFMHQTVGQIATAIDDIDPEDIEGTLRVDGLIAMLPDGVLKSDFKKKLGHKLSGEPDEVKNHLDAGNRALVAVLKGRMEKAANATGVEPQPVSRLLAAGFLSSEEKLQSLGLSADAAAGVAKAGSELKDPAARNAAQLKALRALAPWWNKRGKVTASPFDQAAAEAMMNGESQVSYVSPDSENAAVAARVRGELALGKAQTDYAEWRNLNPEATAEQVEKKVFELGGEATRAELRSSMLQPKPARGGSGGRFVPGETSMNLPAGLQPLSTVFVEEGVKYGLDPRLLAAISMHETAGGTSSAFRNKRNAMGVSDRKGPIAFEDSAASVRRMAALLGSKSSGPYKNARTLGEIAAIYAPVGAENDPRGLNGAWAAGVAKYLKELGGNPLLAIK